MTLHVLKTDREHYERVIAAAKPYEIRLNDRQFREDDTITLRERDPHTGRYTGRQATYIVGHVLRDPHRYWTWEQLERHGLAVLTLVPPTVAYSDLNPDLAAAGRRPPTRQLDMIAIPLHNQAGDVIAQTKYADA